MIADATVRDVLEGRARWCVITGDCLAIMPTIERVDHVITDPPYSAHQHAAVRSGKRNRFTSGNGRAFACNVRQTVDLGFTHLNASARRACAASFARIAARWIACFSDVETCHLWRLSLTAAGLDYIRTCEWRRLNGAPQFTGDRPAASFEAITLAHPAGRKRWNGGGKQGVYEVPIELNRGGNNLRVHTTQKPYDLMAQLVEDFTDPDDLILDPFAGSGTTGVAALRLGRRAILIEKDPKYAAIARERMEAESAGSTLQAARAGQLPLLGGVK